MVRWGVLGYARIARTCLLPAIMEHKDSCAYALATRNAQVASEAKTEFGFEKVYLSYDELLDDSNVDVVYVPLPNSLHKEWAIKAMRKGKNVLCEKPMALNADEAEQMFAVAKECNVLLVEAFMYRFLEKVSMLEKLIDDGVIGDIRMLKSSWRFFLNRVNTIKEKPELGGGCLYDVGCYPVSLVNLIYKELPSEVKVLKNIGENGVDMSISAIMKYPDGKMAQIDAGFDSVSAKLTEISGTKGYIFMPETFVDEDMPITVMVSGESKPRVYKCNVQKRYLEEVKAVHDAIKAGKKELLDPKFSIMNAKLLETILKAD